MSKHKDGAAVTLTHHQQLQPRLRKTTVRAPAVDQEQVQDAAAFQMPQLRNKRKATDSPNKMMDKMVKRSALGNVTNAGPNAGATVAKKTVLQQIDNLKIENSSSKIAKNQTLVTKPVTRASTRKTTTTAAVAAAAARAVGAPKVKATVARIEAKKNAVDSTAVKGKTEKTVAPVAVKPPSRRISNEFDRTGDTLYMSAIDFSDQSSRLSLNGTLVESDPRRRNGGGVIRQSVDEEDEDEAEENKENDDPSLILVVDQSSTIVGAAAELQHSISGRGPVPEGVVDFDLETRPDCFQIGDYAMDIFDYLKSKEAEFPVRDYIGQQPVISRWMRSLLVDWMVEVQESFELNHETLYLAVKLVDLYLGERQLSKEKLQLLGAAALFIACKFDERIPPFIDDFLYICDGAYTRKELIEMERSVFRAVNFNLGVPLSYRFLRRYARCAKIPLPSLTLARYVLEYGLMDYETITRSDSKLAAAALYIALKMLTPSNDQVWTDTLRFYADYELEEFWPEVVTLNDNLNRKSKEKTLNTIKKKYSHKIFYEVALKPHLTNELLFRGTEVEYQRGTVVVNKK